MTQKSSRELWMTREELQKYTDLSAELLKLAKEHQDLGRKALAGQISEEEAQRWAQVRTRFREVEAQRRELESRNPILPENIIKASEQHANRDPKPAQNPPSKGKKKG